MTYGELIDAMDRARWLEFKYRRASKRLRVARAAFDKDTSDATKRKLDRCIARVQSVVAQLAVKIDAK